MDNSNNPNSNTGSTTPTFTPNPTSAPPMDSSVFPSSPSIPQSPTPPAWPATPIQPSTPSSAVTMPSFNNTPPVLTPDPLSSIPYTSGSPLDPTPSTDQPISSLTASTFTSATSSLPSNPTTSPLDNPWSNPQPASNNFTPPSQPAQSTFDPSTINPSITEAIPASTPTVEPPISSLASSQPTNTPDTTSAPTDLSHLLGGNGNTPPEATGQTLNAAETLVVSPQPSSAAADVPTIPAEHKGIPKWLIGVGGGLLIIVAGASAYFILGIGQPSKTTNSIPAEVSKPTVKTAPPVATPVPQPTAPAATESASFGQLQGSGSQTATSAADIIKQRSQAR